MLRNFALLLSFLLIFNTSLNSNASSHFQNSTSQVDSTQTKSLTIKQLIVPATLISLGSLGAIFNDNVLNREINKIFRGNHHCNIDCCLRFAPLIGYIALGEVGLTSKHSLKERVAVAATSHAIMVALGSGLKNIVHEQRPNLSNNHSFPSGHTTMAFTGAELMRIEYGANTGLAGYAVATSVALMRLYNNKHWLNDVVMGAGIGILSARLGYALLPWERKLLGWNKKKASSTIIAMMPTYDFHAQTVALSLVAHF